MATILAAASGNWSATGTWTGGVVPTAGDTVYLNNKNVTLNVNPTADLISNLPLSGAANGGTLVLSDGVVITANLTCGTVALITHSAGENFTVVGDITGGSGSSIRAINSTGTGNIVIVGNLYGGTGASADAARITNASATITVTGNVYGSTTANANGLYSSALTSSITGTVYGGSPSSGGYGISHAGNGTMTINGDVLGGSQVASNYGVYNSSGGTVIITGIAEGGHAGAAVRNQSTGAVYIKRIKGNGWGVGSVAPVVSSTVGLDNFNQAGIAYAEELEYGSLGQSPVSGTVRLTDVATNVVLMHRFGSSHKVLSDPANTAGLVPDESDVRLGVDYALGNNTGTCAVPPASAVGAGVPIDDTVSTAALTAQAVWEYATRTLTEGGGGGLDAEGVRAAIGLASADLDTQLAGISTKTNALPADPAAVSDIPSASANATAVRAELADELANLDAPISEISTGLDAAGVRTAVGLASPDLDTQLAGISTKTSALPAAPAAVSDIPSAAANATAVREELDSELERVRNVATVASVGQLLAETFNEDSAP